MTAQQEIEEKRRSPRSKRMAPATIASPDGYSTIDCLVLDWSDGGARLRPADVMSCPDTFRLITRDGSSYVCTVAWRRGDSIGVTFTA